MSLSEHEQRLLDEMERNLYQNDSDFVTPVDPSTKLSASGITIGVLIAVVGLGVVVAGIAIPLPLVGVLGFAIMVTGVVFALRPARESANAADADSGSGSSPRGGRASSKQSGGFMDAVQRRWDERNEER